MLAMVVNDNAGNLTTHGGLESIASMLAPTGLRLPTRLVNACRHSLPPPAV